MTGPALCGAAMAAFAGSTHRHAPRIFRGPLARPGRRRLRVAGWLLLALAAALLLAEAPAWPIAVVRWFGWVAAAALGTTLLASIAPRRLPGVAVAIVVAALAADMLAAAGAV